MHPSANKSAGEELYLFCINSGHKYSAVPTNELISLSLLSFPRTPRSAAFILFII